MTNKMTVDNLENKNLLTRNELIRSVANLSNPGKAGQLAVLEQQYQESFRQDPNGARTRNALDAFRAAQQEVMRR